MADEALLALRGRVVTMDDDDTVIDHGIVYIRGTHIAAVADEDDPPPAGFEGVRPRKVGGSIYPGLIDLHNHLSYDALPMRSEEHTSELQSLLRISYAVFCLTKKTNS